MRTAVFLAVPFLLLLGGVLAILAAAVQDRWGERWRWPHAAAAVLLAAGLAWVAVAVTRVDEYRRPAEVTLWELMGDARWWVVVAVAAGVVGVGAQVPALVTRDGRGARSGAWALPAAAVGMLLLASVLVLVVIAGSH